MICAWTVTSSAVVGSSAMSSSRVERERHRDHRPLSHPARELVRIVVDSRLLGLRDADPVEKLDRAPPRRRPCSYRSCARIASTICQPTGSAGWRLESGSWKISAISAPRTRRSSSGAHREQVAPVEDRAARRSRAPCVSPTIVCVATLLPEPDSPTIPSVRPLATPNERPRTAWTTPSAVAKRDGQILDLEQRACRQATSLRESLRDRPGASAGLGRLSTGADSARPAATPSATLGRVAVEGEEPEHAVLDRRGVEYAVHFWISTGTTLRPS